MRRKSIPVVTTCTSSGMKAPSRYAPSLSSSFRQVRRVGLTLQTRGTVGSDKKPLFESIFWRENCDEKTDNETTIMLRAERDLAVRHPIARADFRTNRAQSGNLEDLGDFIRQGLPSASASGRGRNQRRTGLA